MTYNDPIELACVDGCKRTAVAEDEIQAKALGWTYLSIQRRFRCPVCSSLLALANTAAQTDPGDEQGERK